MRRPGPDLSHLALPVLYPGTLRARRADGGCTRAVEHPVDRSPELDAGAPPEALVVVLLRDLRGRVPGRAAQHLDGRARLARERERLVPEPTEAADRPTEPGSRGGALKRLLKRPRGQGVASLRLAGAAAPDGEERRRRGEPAARPREPRLEMRPEARSRRKARTFRRHSPFSIT